MSWRRFKPAVARPWLLLLAGLMWSAVGVALCRMAVGWLIDLPTGRAALLGITGLALTVPVFRYGFARIAGRNIDRISRAPERPCLFSFQAWSGYLVIVFMITLGVLMRISPIPRSVLAILYLTIGGGLFFGSFRYYLKLWQMTRQTVSNNLSDQ